LAILLLPMNSRVARSMHFIGNENDPLFRSIFGNLHCVWSQRNREKVVGAYTLGLLPEAHCGKIEAL
jgi:hypothetical protein